jgi:protein transport protein SEC24
VDTSKNSDPRFLRATTGAIPSNAALAGKCGVPLGVVVQPFAEGEDMEDIPVVNFGNSLEAVRCKKCRGYISPFTKFVEGGRLWVCTLCGFRNQVVASYYSRLNDAGEREDLAARPELTCGTVEYDAPQDYMVRAPQPPVYVFVVDVSYSAVSSGMVAAAAETIRESVGTLAANARTQFALITFDSTIHFYRIAADAGSPQMLVMPDLDDPFLPVPEDLLVNLNDNKEAIDTLLESLPRMHESTHSVESATGPALTAAFSIMHRVGGKLCLFQACLPSVGKGKLRPREAPAMLGTEAETSLLVHDQTDDAQHYKHLAVDFSRKQISVDTFLFSANYTDVASIGYLSRYTAGQVYYYPAFTGAVDGPRFASDLTHTLSRTTGFECVLRLRSSAGISLPHLYGSFFVRGSDLLMLPNITSDSTISAEMQYESALQPGSVMYVQVASLYTDADDHRRIRVQNLAIPVAGALSDAFDHADASAIATLLTKQALDTAVRRGLVAARRAVHTAVVDMVRAYRAASAATGGRGMPAHSTGKGELELPETLALLPEMAMCLQKSLMLRGGNSVRSDERAAAIYRLLQAPLPSIVRLARPRLMSVLDMPPQAGAPAADAASMSPDDLAGDDSVVLPPRLPATTEHLRTDGVFLVDNGMDMYLWVGSSVGAEALNALFGVTSWEGVDTVRFTLPALESPMNGRLRAIIDALQEGLPQAAALHVVVQGMGGWEGRFLWALAWDRTDFPGGNTSFTEYKEALAREGQGLAGAGMPHGMPPRR